MSNFFAGPKRITPYIQTAVIRGLQGQPLLHQNSLAQLVDRQPLSRNDNDSEEWIFGRVSDGEHIVGVCFPRTQLMNNALEPGCIVKITNWHVSTKLLCQEKLRMATENHSSTCDAICLHIEGDITSLGGQQLGILGTNVHPLEESIRFRQWFHEYRRDWKKLRSVLLLDGNNNKLPMGDLAAAMEDPEFCQSLLRQADQVRQIFLAKKNDDDVETTVASTTSKRTLLVGASTTTPTTPPSKRLRGTTTAAEDSPSCSPVESEDEDLDIDAMLVSQPQEPIPIGDEFRNNDKEDERDPLKEQPIQPVDNDSERGVLVGDPPGTTLPSLSTGATPRKVDDPMAHFPKTRNTTTTTRANTRLPECDSDDDVSINDNEERPIALQDANDSEIRRAYLQAEQTSPGILRRQKALATPSSASRNNDDTNNLEGLQLPLDPPAAAPSLTTHADQSDDPPTWPWKLRPDSLVEQLYRGDGQSKLRPTQPPPPVAPNQWRGRVLRLWMEEHCMID